MKAADFKAVMLMAAGVILAGAILHWGRENNVPGVRYASGGFDW